MTKKILKRVVAVLVLFVMAISSGCDANDNSSRTYDSDEAAIDAYMGNEAKDTKNTYSTAAIGNFKGKQGNYYFVQNVDESGNVIIHIAVVTEHKGVYSCEKYSPDYELDAVSQDDETCPYISVPFEEKYLNIGLLESDRYSVSIDGDELAVNEDGVFCHVDETDDVTFDFWNR